VPLLSKAHNQLGFCHERGSRSVKCDEVMALHHYRLADNDGASKNLAIFHENGKERIRKNLLDITPAVTVGYASSRFYATIIRLLLYPKQLQTVLTDLKKANLSKPYKRSNDIIDYLSGRAEITFLELLILATSENPIKELKTTFNLLRRRQPLAQGRQPKKQLRCTGINQNLQLPKLKVRKWFRLRQSRQQKYNALKKGSSGLPILKIKGKLILYTLNIFWEKWLLVRKR
jgi:hypothetical protein